MILPLLQTNLLHLFDFVGLYEKLEESIARLCVHLRLPSVDRISPPKVNQTVDRKYASELAAFTIDQILVVDPIFWTEKQPILR